VSRRVGPNQFAPLAATRPPAEAVSTRDTTKVPPPPESVRLQTGDRVPLEVMADRTGYITVFHVGPTGCLSLLYPDESLLGAVFTAPIIPANQALPVHELELTPPDGRERLLAVWSRMPLPLRLDRLTSLVEPKGKKSPVSRPYVATRDIKRIQQSVQELPPQDWQAVVLDLDHTTMS
jgi:hypothetical protein